MTKKVKKFGAGGSATEKDKNLDLANAAYLRSEELRKKIKETQERIPIGGKGSESYPTTRKTRKAESSAFDALQNIREEEAEMMEKREQNARKKASGMKTGGMAKGGKWIQSAIKKPGALRKSLGVKTGEKIPAGKLAKAAKAPGKMGQRARLAQTLKKMK